MNALTAAAAIVYKDLVQELRSKEIISSMTVYALIMISIFAFAFDPGTPLLKEAAPGILWLTLVFSGSIGLSRAFGREIENAGMHGLLLCPVDRSYIYIAKVLGNVLFICLAELLTIPLMVVFFDLTLGPVLLPLAFILLFGSIGFASVGTLFSTIAGHAKSREVMLPLLLFPVVVPVILAGVNSTALLLQNQAVTEARPWIRLLIAFDALFFTAALLLYEHVLEE